MGKLYWFNPLQWFTPKLYTKMWLAYFPQKLDNKQILTFDLFFTCCIFVYSRPIGRSISVENLNIGLGKTKFVRFFKVVSPDNKVQGANMGLTWVLSAPDGPHVGHTNLVIRVSLGRVCKGFRTVPIRLLIFTHVHTCLMAGVVLPEISRVSSRIALLVLCLQKVVTPPGVHYGFELYLDWLKYMYLWNQIPYVTFRLTRLIKRRISVIYWSCIRWT